MMGATEKIAVECLSNIAAELPKLSSMIRYYDDFEDGFNSIRDPEHSDFWDIEYDGEICRLDFSGIPVPLKTIIKHIATDIFQGWTHPEQKRSVGGLSITALSAIIL
jgi:hypothetical protein